MRKYIILLFLSLITFTCAFSQDKQVKVILKNGTTIVGTAVSFDPLSSIVLKVAGMETTIPMDKVDKVEEQPIVTSQVPEKQHDLEVPTADNPLIVTDNADYPDSILVDIAGIQCPFILVHGGEYLMGYDGGGSVSMHSEPIHRVKVTTFYISKRPLQTNVVKQIKGSKSDDLSTFMTMEEKEVKKIIAKVNEYTKLPFRLPSEAEWEFTARGEKRSLFLPVHRYAYELCQDIYTKYSNGVVLTDPINQLPNGKMTCRMFIDNHDLPYARSSSFDKEFSFRLAIKAKDILDRK